MAVYRMSATMVKRSTGRSACAAAAYRAGCEIEDERTGLSHDYTRKRGIEHSEIIAPDDAPEWVHDRAKLWNAVEAKEKRKDAQLAREVLLSLPHELDEQQRRELVREYVREQYVQRGLAADIAIHRAHEKGDDRNHHAHVLLTLRKVDADGLAAKKERDYGKKDQLLAEREAWAVCQNKVFERENIDAHVDHRSLKDRGIDREPEPKLGPVASKMEREGRKSHAGDDLRAVWERNQDRARLEATRKVISLEIERENRRLAQEQEAQRRQTARQEEDGYAHTIPRPSNDNQDKPQPEAKRRDIATDGYASGIVWAQEAPSEPERPDPAEIDRQHREAVLRERVTGLESQIEGRGKASVLWGKVLGRIAWDAEQQLEAQRAALSTMEQARQREDQQRMQDEPHIQRDQEQSKQEAVEERQRVRTPRAPVRPRPEPARQQSREIPDAPEVVQTSEKLEDEHPERLTIAASDAFHAKDRSVVPDDIGTEAESAAKDAERQAKLEQYREMFRASRENARDGPELER